MARHTVDPTKVVAGMIVLDAGDYNFEIASLKGFRQVNKQDSSKVSHGVRVGLVVTTDCMYKGKTITVNMWGHSEGAVKMSKAFQLAAYGYSRKAEDEARFNDEKGMKDFGYDDETGDVGDGWAALKGGMISAEVRVQQDQQGNPQNQFNWRPYGL